MNTIIENLKRIYSSEMATELMSAYQEAKEQIQPESQFNKLMAELVEEIKTVQQSAKPGTSFLSTGLLICIPSEEDDEDDDKVKVFTKAAMCWAVMYNKIETPNE